MTVKLSLPPDLESLVRDRANEEFHGDMEAMVQTALREYLLLPVQPDEIELKLLETLNSPSLPLSDHWCEEVAGRVKLRNSSRAN